MPARAIHRRPSPSHSGGKPSSDSRFAIACSRRTCSRPTRSPRRNWRRSSRSGVRGRARAGVHRAHDHLRSRRCADPVLPRPRWSEGVPGVAQRPHGRPCRSDQGGRVATDRGRCAPLRAPSLPDLQEATADARGHVAPRRLDRVPPRSGSRRRFDLGRASGGRDRCGAPVGVPRVGCASIVRGGFQFPSDCVSLCRLGGLRGSSGLFSHARDREAGMRETEIDRLFEPDAQPKAAARSSAPSPPARRSSRPVAATTRQRVGRLDRGRAGQPLRARVGRVRVPDLRRQGREGRAPAVRRQLREAELHVPDERRPGARQGPRRLQPGHHPPVRVATFRTGSTSTPSSRGTRRC